MKKPIAALVVRIVRYRRACSRLRPLRHGRCAGWRSLPSPAKTSKKKHTKHAQQEGSSAPLPSKGGAARRLLGEARRVALGKRRRASAICSFHAPVRPHKRGGAGVALCSAVELRTFLP